MFVAATTRCFPEVPLLDCVERLIDLQYSAIAIAIDESGDQLKPSQVLADTDKSIALCRDTHRLDIAGYLVNIEATGDEHYRQFEAICRLAKATKVVSLTVPSAELGTPFNEEVEHLRRLVGIATLEGVLVSIRSQVGRLSQDPDTVVVLCDNVKGLGLTLDPSHYVCGPHAGRSYDQVFKYVYGTQLRDTNEEALQVRVGQGEIEYSRLVGQLRRAKYDRALCVDMTELEGIDHNAEMRKLRLLLESLI